MALLGALGGGWRLVNTSMRSMSCCSDRASQMGKGFVARGKGRCEDGRDEAWMASHDGSIGGKAPQRRGTRKLPNHTA